jgi:hypothetical protein
VVSSSSRSKAGGGSWTGLVADFGALDSDKQFLFAQVAAQSLKPFGPLSKWRSVSVVGGSFPADLSKHVDNESSALLPRIERDLWRRMTGNLDYALRFGDYGVVSPDSEGGFRGSANLRYARSASWLALRGPHRDEANPNDYLTLAETLSDMDVWLGHAHCPGCTFIAKRLADHRPGNPTQWRQADFAHHFAVVLDELAA